MDRDGAQSLLEKALKDFPKIELIWVDDGYRSNALKEWINNNCPWRLEFVRRPSPRRIVGPGVEPLPIPAFTVLPRRWVVEIV
jgi:hypothetical protein